MENILKKLLQSDSATIKEGTRELNEAMKSPEAVVWLCEVLCASPEMEVRQYAAIVLRKRLAKPKKWTALNLNAKNHVKNKLLERLLVEAEKPVKTSIVQAMGAIMNHCSDPQSWPELFQFIQHSTTSAVTNDQELGFFTLHLLLGEAQSQFLPHVATFTDLFTTALANLNEPWSPVGYFVILSMIEFLPALAENKEVTTKFIDLHPRVVAVIRGLATKRPDRASEAMDFLYEMAELGGEWGSSTRNPFLSPKVIRSTVAMALDFVREKTLSEDLKMKSLNYISTLVALKLKIFEKNDVLTSLLLTLFQVMCLPPTVEDEEEEYFSSDTEDDTLLTCACEALDSLAMYVKSELLVPPLMEAVGPALNGSDRYRKRGAYLALGILAQGCEDYIKTNGLQASIETVYRGTNEPDTLVRNAALFALVQFAEHLQPEISVYSSELIPLIIKLIGGIVETGCIKPGKEDENTTSSNAGVDRVLYALDKFAENLEEAIIPYVPQLMEGLLTLTTERYPLHTRELTINTISSVATAIKEGILPFFPDIMSRLNCFLTQEQDSDTLCLQVESIDTLGALARALGPVHFRPYSGDAIQLGLRLLEVSEEPDVRKSVYGLLGAVSTVLKEEMAPVLPTFVGKLFDSLRSEEGYKNHAIDGGEEVFTLSESDSGNEDEDGGEEHIDLPNTFQLLENDFIEEKEESCFALKELAANTGSAFAPYLVPSFDEVFKLLSFPNEDVRTAATEAAFQILISVGKMHETQGSGGLQVYQEQLEKLIAKSALMVRTDEDRDVVQSVLAALCEALKELKGLIASHNESKDAIIACIKDVVALKTECQGWGQEGESDDDELIDTASDLVPALGKAMSHTEFSLHFSTLLPLFRDRMLRSGRGDGDDGGQLSSLLGMLAECMEGLGPSVADHLSSILPFLLCHAANSDANVRNNAVYALGEMAYHGKETLTGHYPEILNALSMVMPKEKDAKVLDNICGAIARMILTNTQAIPIEQVLPVFLQTLPLREDFAENVWVYNALSHLYTMGNPTLKNYVSIVARLAAHVLTDKSSDAETQQVVLNLLKMMQVDFPEELVSLAGQLPQETREALEKAFSET